MSGLVRCGLALALFYSATSAEDDSPSSHLDRQVRLATGEDERARDEAITALRNVGPPAWRALRDVLEDTEIGWRAALALARIGKPTLPVLIDAVKTGGDQAGTDNVRLALVLLGETAVPPLVGALNESHADEQARIAETLGCMRPLAGAAIPALQARLRTKNVALCAAVALTKIGGATEDAIAVLALQLDTSRECIDRRVIGAIARSGCRGRSALPSLHAALERASQADRIDLLRAIWAVEGKGDFVVPELIRALQDKSPRIRSAAADALAMTGEGDPAIPHLLRLVEVSPRRESLVYESVCDEMGLHPRWAREVAKWLRLENRDDLHNKAVAVLSAIRPRTRATTSLLAFAATSPRVDVRQDAVMALGRGPPSAEVVNVLTSRLQDESDDVALWATVGLARCGKAAVPALPALRRSLRRDALRLNALMALGKVGASDPESVRELIRTLRDGDTDARRWAAAALGLVGPAASDAVSDLREALQSKVSPFGVVCAQSLWEIRRDAQQVVPYLSRALAGPTKHAALEALAAVGPAAGQALPAIEGMLDPFDAEGRAWAAWAVWRVGQNAADPLRHLIRVLLLDDYNPDAAVFAVRAMAAMGRDAKPALPALRGILRELDAPGHMRIAVRRAIASIAQEKPR